MKAAIADFERALAIDPDYALARAGLAIASAWFSIRYAYETEASEWGARAERDAKAALAGDPSLAEATLAMASAAGTLHGAFNWPVVIAEATRALAIDPTLELGHVVRMRAFYHLGLFDRMADEARAAYQLNPLGNVEIARLEVAGSLFSGSHERAREQAEALLARGADAPIIRNYLGLAQFYAGDVAAARATLAAVTAGGTAGRPFAGRSRRGRSRCRRPRRRTRPSTRHRGRAIHGPPRGLQPRRRLGAARRRSVPA